MAGPEAAPTTAGVWAEFRGRLLAFLRARVRSEHDAEDLLQEVFLKLHARLGTLQARESLGAFVFQVARNAVVDFHRRKNPSGDLPADVAALEPEERPAAELASCLRPLMRELPEGDREALELTELGGLTQAELAERMGLSVTGGKSKVQRARTRLRSVLEDCCKLELDRRGNVRDFTSRRPDCCQE